MKLTGIRRFFAMGGVKDSISSAPTMFDIHLEFEYMSGFEGVYSVLCRGSHLWISGVGLRGTE